MDQAPIQEIDVHEGLESTLTILSHKLKSSSITVTREYDRTLPRISAYGSELNEIEKIDCNWIFNTQGAVSLA
jgi:nitrogen-specific signal transduction histidine kinase